MAHLELVGFRDEGLGLWVLGLGLRAQGLWTGLELRVQGLGFRGVR